MEPHEKIKEARKQLDLSQSEMAERLGVSQNEVSKLEAGGKKFIPNSYIVFLLGNGFDINSIFDDELPLKKLSESSQMVAENDGIYENLKHKNERLVFISTHFDGLLEHLDEKVKKGELEIDKRLRETISQWMACYEPEENDSLRLFRLENTVAKLVLDMNDVKIKSGL